VLSSNNTNKVFRRTIKRIKAIPRKGKEPYLSFKNIIGFYPDHIQLYYEAVSHRSSSTRGENGKWVNNERLEFLGDAILDAIVADILFKRFPQKKEGFLTSMRSRIVQRDTLNKIAVEMGLDKLIISSTRNLAHNTNIYGDALEALIGAIYLDQGYRVAKHFVFETLIKQHLSIDAMMKREVDFKSRIIEWGQKNKIDVEFILVNSSYDEQNNPIFVSSVSVGGMEIGLGNGYSKKESHQMAAKQAIHKMREDTSLQQTIIENARNISADKETEIYETNFDELGDDKSDDQSDNTSTES